MLSVVRRTGAWTTPASGDVVSGIILKREKLILVCANSPRFRFEVWRFEGEFVHASVPRETQRQTDRATVDANGQSLARVGNEDLDRFRGLARVILAARRGR